MTGVVVHPYLSQHCYDAVVAFLHEAESPSSKRRRVIGTLLAAYMTGEGLPPTVAHAAQLMHEAAGEMAP